MNCPTDLPTVKTNILTGLNHIRDAYRALQRCIPTKPPNKWSAEEQSKVAQTGDEWFEISDGVWCAHLEKMPRPVRKRLPQLYDPSQRAQVLSLRYRIVRRRSRKSAKPKDTKAIYSVRNGSDLVRVLVGDRYFYKVLLPDKIDAAITQAKQAFASFEKQGVTDFAPSIDEIRKTIRQVVGSRSPRWMRLAESTTNPTRVVARMIGDRRPTRGVPKDDLLDRVREIDPAVDLARFRTAVEEMLESGELKLENHEWTGHDGKPAEDECYILSDTESPAKDDGAERQKSGGKHGKDEPKSTETMGKAAKMAVLIGDQEQNDTGMTLGEMLKRLNIPKDTFRNSKHFKGARDDWKRLKAARECSGGQSTGDANVAKGEPITCRSCDERIDSYTCPKCEEAADQCRQCHAESFHGVVTPP